MPTRFPPLFVFLATCSLAAAQEPTAAPDAGHSHFGEAFNEGPRQQAYLMNGTGNVHFPVATRDPRTQQFIDQGVGQLHGFWYFEAERSFRQAAAIDPDCAIAYWGMAMANRSNEKRAEGFIAEAVQRKDRASARERMWIDALDAYFKADSKKQKERGEKYVAALENILHEHPDDIEAKAFLALQIYYNRSDGHPITSFFAVDALMNDVLAANPQHPIHHYRIHLWDYEKPERALDSAAACGPSAPSIAHMWHMPGHIYSRLHRYEDAAWQQEASARVDHAHMARDRVMPDQIHNFAHNNEWLCRNLVHVGRWRDAVELAKNMISLPRHPENNTLSKRGSTYYGRLRLFETLAKYELWDETIALCHSAYLEPTDDAREQVKRLRALGAAHFRSGDVENGRTVLAELEERLQRKRDDQQLAARDAEETILAPLRPPAPPGTHIVFKPDAETAKKVEEARKNATKRFAAPIRALERALDELRGRAAVAEADYKTAYDLLKKAGGVEAGDLARVQFLAGDGAAAEAALRKECERSENEILPRAHLVDLLWQRGERDEAAKAFEEMRSLSGSIQLGSPVFDRLAPIALELSLPEDWRTPSTPAADIGKRPDLATLGPFRWSPYEAPEWTLADPAGQTVSLSDYRGRPVVVIFYLGFGCLHCAEQLQAFAPKTEEFKQAGLELVGISIEDPEMLKTALANAPQQPFPFPLLSDAPLEVFRRYRAYDDFESLPLHATFLIDGAGRVRWQDISYEPFKDADFVLKEARRLLAQDALQTVSRP